MAKRDTKQLTASDKLQALKPRELWLSLVIEIALLYFAAIWAIDSGNLWVYFGCIVLTFAIVQTLVLVAKKHLKMRRG